MTADRSIFVSCGQFTDAEKTLGEAIAKMVRAVTGFGAFFAEGVQDLNGLDSNILEALRNTVGFITVLHPRGTIVRPDGTTHVRASVWIEQEIAIATYIQRTEKRSLPIIAFIHESVSREGLRELLHLNPIPFSNEVQVLTALQERLTAWKSLSPTGIVVSLHAEEPVPRDGHYIRRLVVTLTNHTNLRVTKWNGSLRLPSGVLKHWSTAYIGEERSTDPKYRVFRLDEEGYEPIRPQSTITLTTFDYCTQCAAEDTREISAIASALVGESLIEVKVWIDGREYSDAKTVKELSQSA